MDILVVKYDSFSNKVINGGKIVLPVFDAEKCWDLCNYSCWAEQKPKEMSECSVSLCNADVAFLNPIDGHWYRAMLSGFRVFNTKEEAITSIQQDIIGYKK